MKMGLTDHRLQVGANVAHYRNLPRLVGECGGKNFHLVHRSADMATVVNATLRGAFEYSGQKCSATSRLYVPASLWPQVCVCVFVPPSPPLPHQRRFHWAIIIRVRPGFGRYATVW